jgi:hypothetical protein
VPSFAGVVWDESINGPLSSNGLSPTAITLLPGSNQLLGSNGSTGGIRDYVTFTIPIGEFLKSITMLNTAVGNIGFIGIEAGNQLTLPTNASTAAGLLGWRHYVQGDIGTDILPLMGIVANQSTGFTPPLPSGTYSLWIQDSSPGTFFYGFDLQVTTPEPATWTGVLAAVAGLGMLQLLRRRPAKAR